MSTRFDYVKYGEGQIRMQESAKSACIRLESVIELVASGRAKSLALTALEECYMWIGKGIRDDQVELTYESVEQPERGNS